MLTAYFTIRWLWTPDLMVILVLGVGGLIISLTMAVRASRRELESIAEEKWQANRAALARKQAQAKAAQAALSAG